VRTGDIQSSVKEWHDRNFPTQSLAIDQVVLTEEVGELSRVIAKMDQKIRGTDEEWLIEARKEIGDILISLANVGNSLDIDIMAAWQERWDTVSLRDWNADRIQHGIEAS
jgi:NTP pyrophosphatase (non-canonical NTP hydrolase)